MAVVGVELRRAAAGRLVTLALPRYWQARLEVLLRGLPILPFAASAAIAHCRIIAQRGWARGRDYDRKLLSSKETVMPDLVPGIHGRLRNDSLC